MITEDKIKLFAMSRQMAERDLDAVKRKHRVNLGRQNTAKTDKDEEYYPQFDQSVRAEAAAMAAHYELFYCLEKSIRSLVSEKLEAELGANWWNQATPANIKTNVQSNMQREVDSGVTLRSTREIDYTTFGELGEIVRTSWDKFSDTFNSQKAFTRVMTSLNVLRGPIAHCSPLAEDEIVRLKLTVKDWFRLME